MKKTIEIPYDGKKLPMRVSYKAIIGFEKHTKKKVDDLDSDMTLMEPLLYFALKSGHEAEGIDFDFKMEDMADILDESLAEINNNIADFFSKGRKK